jgi:hypothetical protein
MRDREGADRSAKLAKQIPYYLHNLINAVSLKSLGSEIRLNEKRAVAIWRLDLSLFRSPRNSNKPQAIVISAWMCNLQLRNLNSGEIMLESLDDLVDVALHITHLHPTSAMISFNTAAPLTPLARAS